MITWAVRHLAIATLGITGGHWPRLPSSMIGTRKFDRVLGQILHDQLHWLDVPDWVLFKLAVTVHQCLNGRAPPYLSEHCLSRSAVLTRGGICVPPTVTYLPYRVSGSTLTAVGRSQLLSRWPGTHSRILSGIQRAAQTVLGIYLKRTCSCDTSASSALGVLNDYALCKSTHSLTHSSKVILHIYLLCVCMVQTPCRR